MSLQFSPTINAILSGFQRTGLSQGQAYQKEQFFSALDKLSGQLYDRDVAQQLFEQCQPNQRGQVQLEDFAQVIMEADKVLKKKINQTEQQIQLYKDELKECQQQAQELQYNQKLNPQGVDRDSQLIIVIKQAHNIQYSNYQCSFIIVSLDGTEIQSQMSSGDKYNPIFNQQLNFLIQTGSEEILIKLFVQDKNQGIILIGQSHLDLGEMHDQQVHSQQLQLVNERQQQLQTFLQIESQWIHNKLKYHQELILKYEQTIQQSLSDIDDYHRDLLTIQQPFLENNMRNNLQQSLKQPQIQSLTQQNQAFTYQQQQNYVQQQKPFYIQQQQQQNIQINQPDPNQIEDQLSDELYYGFILYMMMLVLTLFQCFARPDYLNLILAMLYLIIVIRDCFEPTYIKILIVLTVLSVVYDIVWISIYKNWWSGTDKTLPTWGEAGDPIVRMTIVFCVFNIILKTALCYILFHYYKESQANKIIVFKFWQFEFQVGLHKQNLFINKGLLEIIFIHQRINNISKSIINVFNIFATCFILNIFYWDVLILLYCMYIILQTYLSMQVVCIQFIVGFVILFIVLSAIQVIRFGPGFIDKSVREKLDTKLLNELQEELKLLMMNEDRLFQILDQNQCTQEITEEQLIHILNIKVQESNGITICKICQSYKPSRAHHCSQCKQCVFRMDHHCMWLNICIGLKNYKYFFMLIFYINLCLIIVLITYFQTYTQAIHQSDTQLLAKFTYYHSIFLLFLLFFPFFLNHLRLAINNQTTIEYYKFKLKTNPFFISYWENLKEILGSEWYYWLLPI
ncbi:unnamed protein product [Paramecium sonneborni]|uniref:Palmitoyltransferase n=1 Tax=Paramecium sonneborni TaxID=65129 RepID=A0A8S1KQK9_9CILI|nr:unnamed protein product [Paramecium sonneborni]